MTESETAVAGFSASDSLVAAFHSPQGLAYGLARQSGADFAAIIACDDGFDTIVDVYPTDLGWAINAPAPSELLQGERAGSWTTTNSNLPAAPAGTLAAHLHELGFASAGRVFVGDGDRPYGRVLFASKSHDWHMPEPIPVFEQMLQGLSPYIRDSARSAQRAMQRQLLQAQKMESLGSMAGMIAHDFNNLLTTVLGYTSLLKISPTMSERDRASLDLIEDAAHRAADLSGRLLTFARGGLARFGPLDLRAVIHDSVKLAEPAIHEKITVSVDLPGAPVPIEGDGSQMQQAVLNIVLNAVDAMPDGGSITISLRAEGDQAVLVIADDGPGMDEETQIRIFEPFFTTKPIGSGSGLGMAITYGIVVQSHEGSINLETAPGRGARFTLRLPLLQEPTEHLTFADPAVDTDLVLIVDDDDMVRRATGEAIKYLGLQRGGGFDGAGGDRAGAGAPGPVLGGVAGPGDAGTHGGGDVPGAAEDPRRPAGDRLHGVRGGRPHRCSHAPEDCGAGAEAVHAGAAEGGNPGSGARYRGVAGASDGELSRTQTEVPGLKMFRGHGPGVHTAVSGDRCRIPRPRRAAAPGVSTALSGDRCGIPRPRRAAAPGVSTALPGDGCGIPRPRRAAAPGVSTALSGDGCHIPRPRRAAAPEFRTDKTGLPCGRPVRL